MPFVSIIKLLADIRRVSDFSEATHAIPRLVHNVNNGFNDGESTVTVLIDMEKVYDRFAL